MCRQVPRELYNNLMLLHSYILVKYLIPLGDHKTAARMLLRVAKSASPRSHKPFYCAMSLRTFCFFGVFNVKQLRVGLAVCILRRRHYAVPSPRGAYPHIDCGGVSHASTAL